MKRKASWVATCAMTVGCSLAASTRSPAAMLVQEVSAGPITCAAGETSCSARVVCPAGTVVTGGGVMGAGARIEAAYPDSDTSWTITVTRDPFDYGAGASASGEAYAICAPAPAGYLRIAGPVFTCDQTAPSCQSTLLCAPGKAVLGGGMRGIQSQLESSYAQSASGWAIGWYKADDIYGGAAFGFAAAYAICADTPIDGYQLKSSTASLCTQPGTACASTLQCGLDQVVVGGGFKGNQSKPEAFVPLSLRDWSVAWHPADDEYAGNAYGQGVAQLVCANGDAIFANSFEQ